MGPEPPSPSTPPGVDAPPFDQGRGPGAGRDAVLAAVAHAATRFLRGDRWDDEIDDVLASLGRAIEVDRLYLFTVRGAGPRTLSYQLSEWVAEGVDSQLALQLFQGFDMAANGFERWIELLPQGRTISGLCRDLPAAEGQPLMDLGIQAIAVVPIEVNGRWWGWLAFEQTRDPRDWSPIELDALQAAANVLGASIQRHELTDLLREKEARTETSYRLEREVSERLRALDALKDTFLTAISHEFRTPLTAIRGFGTTLVDRHRELETAQRLELTERLVANVERLDTLLGELLDLNRVGQNVIAAAPRRIAVEPLLRDAVERTAGLGDHPLSIHTDVETARLDPELVRRILDNLLRNVVRHTPAGTEVELWVTAIADGVLLRVDDAGPGVAEELHEAVFEPFQHGPTAPTHAPGAGIGLSLVARFATVHGGRAWVESRPDGGASFRVVLTDVPSGTG
jgi:signal transduction histidine kinase